VSEEEATVAGCARAHRLIARVEGSPYFRAALRHSRDLARSAAAFYRHGRERNPALSHLYTAMAKTLATYLEENPG